MDDFNRCPFCGGRPEIYSTSDVVKSENKIRYVRPRWVAECKKCQLFMIEKLAITNHEERLAEYSDIAFKALCLKWNKRMNDKTIKEKEKEWFNDKNADYMGGVMSHLADDY